MRSPYPLIDSFTELLSVLYNAMEEFKSEIAADEHEIARINTCLNKLRARIINACNRASRLSDSSESKEICYVFASYCDDYFIYRADWGVTSSVAREAIRSYWLSHLCEWECFGTRIAGWKLPQAARALVERSQHDNESRCMALIYAQIFWLGIGPITDGSVATNTSLRNDLLSLSDELLDPSRADGDRFGYIPPDNEPPQRLAPVGAWLQKLRLAFFTLLGGVSISWIAIYFWVQSVLSGVNG